MEKNTIYLTEQELHSIIKNVLQEMMNETAGANNEAIKLIETEIIPYLSKLRPYTSNESTFLDIELSNIGTVHLTIIGLGIDSTWKVNNMAKYIIKNNTIEIRASRLNMENWEVELKSDIMHELTHALQIQGFNKGAGPGNYAERTKARGNFRLDDISSELFDLYDDSELNARRAQLFFDLQFAFDGIPDSMKHRTDSPSFVSYLIEQMNPYHKLNDMRALLNKISSIDVTYKQFQLVKSWASSINSSLYDTGVNIQKEYDNTEESIRLGYISKKVGYDKLNDLTTRLKKEVLRTMRKKYTEFYDKINELCKRITQVYRENGYQVPANLWHTERDVKPVKRRPLFENN